MSGFCSGVGKLADSTFRYGTVNRPIHASERYDLDNVTTLAISRTARTSEELYGHKIKAYALAHNMLEPVEEKTRCWRLLYTDEVTLSSS